MARRARFTVYGRFDGATRATVVIDRGASLIGVRPYRRRKTYTLPLATAAEMVVWRIVKADVAERKRKKSNKRR